MRRIRRIGEGHARGSTASRAAERLIVFAGPAPSTPPGSAFNSLSRGVSFDPFAHAFDPFSTRRVHLFDLKFVLLFTYRRSST
ncbi:protein of unknown function [Pararobbsia alpina]